ncbi:hypothetical protein BH09ACT8_BH09ACT8_25970 [soil metagenome]
MTTRTCVALAIAGAFIGPLLPSGVLATPIAHADDPLAPIRGAVNGDRSRTGCPPFSYSRVLEDAAQASVRFQAHAGFQPPAYDGKTTDFTGIGDPDAAAINSAYKRGAGAVISDCSYTDFGVGFVRDDSSGYSYDIVTIFFGTRATQKAPTSTPSPTSDLTLTPTPASQQCPAGSPTPTVPTGATCAEVPPPTDKVSVSFDKGFQWTVNVTSTADIPGKCTYAAANPVLPGSNKNFDIGPRGSASFTVPAPPPFSTYHVVVSCGGTFESKNVEFGHVEQDVSA